MTRQEDIDRPGDPLQDAALQPFLQPDFDPATFLNGALPALSTTTEARSSYTHVTTLAEVSVQAQSLLSKLSSHTTRLSNNLTQLTDEIIRSGGRLAYEVELLRGETIGLSETLHDGLKEEIQIFVPKTEPIQDVEAEKESTLEAILSLRNKNGQPDYLIKLQTLTAVRDRLDEVMKLFDDAMKWPMAPPPASGLASSLISVSNPVSSAEAGKLEALAKEYIDDLRKELNGMLRQGGDGSSTALRKMQRLRAIAEIWKGTAEEKARSQVIDDLQKLVNDQYKDESTGADRSGTDYRLGTLDSKLGNDNGYGFLSNLRNLKNEVYLE